MYIFHLNFALEYYFISSMQNMEIFTIWCIKYWNYIFQSILLIASNDRK